MQFFLQECLDKYAALPYLKLQLFLPFQFLWYSLYSYQAIARRSDTRLWKYVYNKKKGKDNLHPVMDKENSEALNAFSVSVQLCSQGSALIIQGEMMSDLLHHLDTHKATGLVGIHQKSTAGAGRSAHWANFHHLPAALPNWWGSTWLKVSECATQLQEILERELRELQPCESDLSAGEGNGVHHKSNATWYI